MAKKMYYTEEEAASALGVSVEDLGNFVRDQKLRVFQDGARKMFRADEVDAIGGGSDESAEAVEPVEAVKPIASGETEIELSPADSVAQSDTASLSEAEDVQPTGSKEDTVLSSEVEAQGEGVSIFDDEDLDIELADPMAKTHVAPSLQDQISMEGSGGGSGLLDLTRESDDTSIGADVLEQIDMDGELGSGIGSGLGTGLGTGIAAEVMGEAEPMGGGELAQPVVVEAIDPMAGLFTGLVAGAAVVALVLGGVVLAVMQNQVPRFLAVMKDNMAAMAGGAVLLVGLAGLAGFFLGKSIAARKQALRQAH